MKQGLSLKLPLAFFALTLLSFVSGSEATATQRGINSLEVPEPRHLQNSDSDSYTSWWNQQQGSDNDEYMDWNQQSSDADEDLGLGWIVMVFAMLFGILPFYSLFAICFVSPLYREYREEGKNIIGMVTGAKKKVRTEFHGSASRGLFGGVNINGHTTERTTNRILDVEYPVIVDGQRKIVRKKFRFLHKKTFDRPSQTSEVELYLLPERGILSAWPRDEFHVSKSEKCKDYASAACFYVLYLTLLIIGVQTSPPALSIFAVLFDVVAGLSLCYLMRHLFFHSGKILRIAVPEDLEAFDFDCQLEDTENIHLNTTHEEEHQQVSVPFKPGMVEDQANTMPQLVAHETLCAFESEPVDSEEESIGGSYSAKSQLDLKNASDSCLVLKPSTVPPIVPTDKDVCFGAEDHPGTKDWHKVIKNSMADLVDSEFCLEVYRHIKKKLGGRRFLIKNETDGDWKEASKTDLVSNFRIAFEKEQKRFFDDDIIDI